MMKNEDHQVGQQDLLNTAKSMLAGDFNLLSGVRRICELRLSLDDPEDEVFLPIRAIDSETDGFPIGAVREKCSPAYLKKADADADAYLAEAREDILEACRNILRKFS